ncbi:phosphoserine phosphatase SerB [Novosphingobium sp.]|uniref:phosphoserine phosphatase SerB n=1 Tax=Novosphingobium sp. TaxID=1874826 RepID=UPI0035AEA9EE
MLIARLIAEPARLAANCDHAVHALEARGFRVHRAEPLRVHDDVLELAVEQGGAEALRSVLDAQFAPVDLLVADHAPGVPRVFVSDMDSTMIQAECIDELADFAGLKAQIADITERAMQGELDFAEALTERVRLLGGLGEDAILQCLEQRIAPMPGARALVETLKAQGCHTVLVTGGFHQFADPVAEELGFERVVANRLGVEHGKLNGGLVGGIVDSSIKEQVLREEVARLGGASLATGDGANDIPMLRAASYGVAYHAKPKARAAAHGWIDAGDLTSVLKLLCVPREEWVWE